MTVQWTRCAFLNEAITLLDNLQLVANTTIVFLTKATIKSEKIILQFLQHIFSNDKTAQFVIVSKSCHTVYIQYIFFKLLTKCIQCFFFILLNCHAFAVWLWIVCAKVFFSFLCSVNVGFYDVHIIFISVYFSSICLNMTMHSNNMYSQCA